METEKSFIIPLTALETLLAYVTILWTIDGLKCPMRFCIGQEINLEVEEMGMWGFELYQNDTALDVKDEFEELFNAGETVQKITAKLTEDYKSIMGDNDEEPLFWFALADTQWNLGVLLPAVKEKALYWIDKDCDIFNYQTIDISAKAQRKKTLDDLQAKLLSPQPPVKKAVKRRVYKCQWKLGDVFAYCFSSEYSKEKGFYGQYVVFRKVSEDTWYPGHIIPVVQVYKWIGNDIPAIDKLSNFDLLPAFYKPSVFIKFPNKILDYEISLISESKKVIPIDNLKFLGNLPGNDLIPFRGHDYWTGYYAVGWESSKYNAKFEHYIINMYLAWKEA